MRSKRLALVVIPALLGLSAASLATPPVDALAATAPPGSAVPVPRAENAILDVRMEQFGRQWIAEVEYVYTGEPADAHLAVVQATRPGVMPGAERQQTVQAAVLPKKGRHSIALPIRAPRGTGSVTTELVTVRLQANTVVLASRTVVQRIEWPDPASKPAEMLAEAIELIDTDRTRSIKEARPLLESVLRQDPRNAQAYLELSRVAMKLNWGPEGLGQAEAFIKSAMQISPDSPNAKILLGYVYAYQGRYEAGEALLRAASLTDTKNLWLWASWGDLLRLQGKTVAAMAKYKEAVARPPTRDPNDRARLYAYHYLIDHHVARQELAAAEAFHKQRVSDYGAGHCHGVAYARFLLLQRRDGAAAEALVKDADASCDESERREVLGLARYLRWSQAADAERADVLRQARVALPLGANVFYAMAREERLAPVVRQLVAAGENLGMQDNRKMDALALALAAGDAEAARRLLALGARADGPAGPDQMPAALIPVLARDWASIKVLQAAGVDYAKLRFQGMTALDHARKSGDTELLRALDPKARKL